MRMKDDFIVSVLGSSDGEDNIPPIQESVASSLGYIAWGFSADSLVSREIFHCILRQFETDSFRDNEIHAIAYSNLHHSRLEINGH